MFNTTYHSTWYSSTLHSDGSGTGTSYDYTYGNSYSYMSSGSVAKWDYKTNDWNTTGGSSYDADRGFYSPTLQSDGNGYTSYDYSYGSSYSYDYLNSDVHKWDYSASDWNATYHSTWYSSSLSSDGSGTGTSYDYSYMNSYSYDSTNGDVHKWDYKTSDWNQTSSDQTDTSDTSRSMEDWYSSSLRSDGYGYLSYDYSYYMSYSYDSSGSDVHKWDYSTNSWTNCYYNMCMGSSASSLAQKNGGKPELLARGWSTPLLVSGLVLASLTAVGMAASKCKKQKGQTSHDLDDNFTIVN